MYFEHVEMICFIGGGISLYGHMETVFLLHNTSVEGLL